MGKSWWSVLAVLCLPIAASARGLVAEAVNGNQALLVGAPISLAGVDIDLKNVEKLSKLPEHGFEVTSLWDAKATSTNTTKALTATIAKVPSDGTFLFYFSGHGWPGLLRFTDRRIGIGELRKAMEKGRANLGPVRRLVMVFDACYSETLLSGIRSDRDLAAELIRELSGEGRAAYWKELFAFAAANASENAQPSSQGSLFTLAWMKGFQEALLNKGTLGDWIALTKKYSKYQHPVARLEPKALATESL